MASALATSRRFVAEALARVRSGLESYDRNLESPGDEIKVEPFDATNVSTPAALIKLATTIGAAKRSAANRAAAQQDVELGREKTRAEIARMRAEAAYAMGEGRQPAERTPATLSSDVGPYKRGTPLTDVNADLANRRIVASERNRAGASVRSGRVTAARAAIADIQSRIERDVNSRAQFAMNTADPVFKEILESGDEARPEALVAVGIDPASWKAQQGYNRSTLIRDARNALFEKYKAKHRYYITRYFEPQRRKYQAVIEDAAEGFDTVDEVMGGGQGADPNDPLGLGAFEGP